MKKAIEYEYSPTLFRKLCKTIKAKSEKFQTEGILYLIHVYKQQHSLLIDVFQMLLGPTLKTWISMPHFSFS